MAQITLNPGETFTVAGGVNTISGTTQGGETVIVSGGVNTFTPDFNAGGDRVVLTGSASQYLAQRSGSSIILRGPNGTVVTFPAPNPNLPDALNPVISFTSGTRRDFVFDTTVAGGFSLGGTSITGAPVVLDTSPGTIMVNVTAASATETPATGVSTAGGFVFTLAEAQAQSVSFAVTNYGGTAIRGVDYLVGDDRPLTVTFAPFETVQRLGISAIDDMIEEGNETVTIQLRTDDGSAAPSGVVFAPGSTLTTTIIENRVFDYAAVPLTLMTDDYANRTTTAAFGALAAGQAGKLLSANDRIVGAGADSVIRLTDTNGASVIDDVDFSGVTNVGTLQTNFGTIGLGAQADRAGIVNLQTQFVTDSRALSTGVAQRGTFVDLTLDGNGDGIADFNNPLSLLLANSTADTVRLTLRSAAGSTIDTGGTFQPANGAAFGPIDTIQIVGETNPVNLTFTFGLVANGSPYDPNSQRLAVSAQATNALGQLAGGVTRFDDEGVRFTGATFQIGVGVGALGGYSEVIFGTAVDDVLTATGPGAAYIVGGAGNDQLVGGAGADFLFAGSGINTLTGGLGADRINGGGTSTFIYTAAAESNSAGYDILSYSARVDKIDLPGGSRAVASVTTGHLSTATIDADLSAAMAGVLQAGGATTFRATSGDLSGLPFLIADGNGVAGYQAGQDYVILLNEGPLEAPLVTIV